MVMAMLPMEPDDDASVGKLKLQGGAKTTNKFLH